MARRTISVIKVQYWKKRARDAKPQDLANLPDGTDFSRFAYSVWNGATAKDLLDTERQRYCNPQRAVVARGSAFVATAASGNYGDPASLQDVLSGDEVLSHKGELANAIPMRIAVTSPLRGTAALIFVEHVQGLIFGQRFVDHLRKVWAQEFPEWTLDTKSLARPDAWLKSANLKAVVAEMYSHGASLEDHGQSRSLGTLRSTLMPFKGQKYFPNWLWSKLNDSSISKKALLGLTEEPDEVLVTLGDGDQEKTFALGSSRTPPVRYLLTDYGAPALSEPALLNWALDEARSLGATVGGDWQTQGAGTNAGWAQEDLELKRVIVDEQQGLTD